MDTLVVRVDPIRRQWWADTLAELLPELKVARWDEDTYQPADVVCAVVWNPPPGGLADFPRLRCVISVGAGVSHILKDPTYPRSVPIIRTTSHSLRRRMTEYVLLHVLRIHRRLPAIEHANRTSTWTEYIEPLAHETRIGPLGVGNLGHAAAQGLSAIGYQVSGWTRRGTPVAGMTIYSGPQGLHSLLESVDIVVSMLPLTPLTTDLLDQNAFNHMRPGSSLINVGRGETIVDTDLLRALDAGHLASATLDVFREEPLPPHHPFWSHPHVLVTCHTASAIEPRVGGHVIATNIRTFLSGQPVTDLVDLDQGY